MNKKSILKTVVLCTLLSSFVSCNKTNSSNNLTQEQIDSLYIIPSGIMTAEKRAKLTPNDVVEILKKGNEDYCGDKLTVLNTSQRIKEATFGQYPIATVLSCIDSRVPVEDVFHVGIGDIFVARIAGNIVDEDILGSLEYATEVSGAKVLVVLGHEYCGAIKSAINKVEMGNITSLLSKIEPAIKEASKNYDGKKNAKNPEFVERVCDNNVFNSIKEIRSNSPIIRELEKKGELIIIGGVYDIKTGKVDFL